MSENPNFDWQALINQTKQAEVKQEQPATTSDLQQYYNQQVARIENPPIQELTQLNPDVPEDDEDDEPEELLAGEVQPTVTFELQGIAPKPVAKPATVNLGLDSLFTTAPQVGQQVTGKRGPGRPRKVDTAQALIDNFPTQINTEQDQFKSAGINQNQPAQIKQNGTEKTITINKKTLQQIAEGIIGIGTAIKEFADR